MVIPLCSVTFKGGLYAGMSKENLFVSYDWCSVQNENKQQAKRLIELACSYQAYYQTYNLTIVDEISFLKIKKN